MCYKRQLQTSLSGVRSCFPVPTTILAAFIDLLVLHVPLHISSLDPTPREDLELLGFLFHFLFCFPFLGFSMSLLTPSGAMNSHDLHVLQQNTDTSSMILMTSSSCSPSPDCLLKEFKPKMLNIGLLLVSNFSIQRAKPRNFELQTVVRRRTMKKKIFFLTGSSFQKKNMEIEKRIVKKQVGIVKVL